MPPADGGTNAADIRALNAAASIALSSFGQDDRHILKED
jgi:hypothetical protein